MERFKEEKEEEFLKKDTTFSCRKKIMYAKIYNDMGNNGAVKRCQENFQEI